MTLKLRILRSLTGLFIILVSLMRSLFSEKMLISNRCISGLMSNLMKKSWTVSNLDRMLIHFNKCKLDAICYIFYLVFALEHFKCELQQT